MAQFFDEAAWQRIIRQPDWYVQLYPQLEALRRQWEIAPEDEANAIKRAVRGFFANALEEGTVALANDGPDLDRERLPIDTIVIHHTSAKPGYRLSYMNATQMLNIYVPYFMNPTNESEKNLKAKPLWSNHVRDGRSVFYAYHWLMRMDGSFERLLDDNELGWHAANCDINRRSVALCLDNDYEKHDPSPEILDKLANFITQNYSDVPVDRIIGHGEVSNHPTDCPGSNFVKGWKDELLRAIGQI